MPQIAECREAARTLRLKARILKYANLFAVFIVVFVPLLGLNSSLSTASHGIPYILSILFTACLTIVHSRSLMTAAIKSFELSLAFDKLADAYVVADQTEDPVVKRMQLGKLSKTLEALRLRHFSEGMQIFQRMAASIEQITHKRRDGEEP